MYNVSSSEGHTSKTTISMDYYYIKYNVQEFCFNYSKYIVNIFCNYKQV